MTFSISLSLILLVSLIVLLDDEVNLVLAEI